MVLVLVHRRRLSPEKPSVWPLGDQLQESYLFERRADMNSVILRNEARPFKNFAVPLSYETVGNFPARRRPPILADVVKVISQFIP